MGFLLGVVRVAFAGYLQVAINFAFSIWVARVLGPEARGSLAAAVLLSAAFVSLFGFGISSAVSLYSSQRQDALKSCLKVIGYVSALGGAGVFIAVSVMPWIGQSSQILETLKVANVENQLLVLSGYTLFQISGACLAGLLIARQMSVQYLYFSALGALVTAASGALAFINSGTLSQESVLLCYAVGAFASTMFGLFITVPLAIKSSNHVGTAQIISLGLRLAPGQIFSFAQKRADSIIVATFLSLEDLGIYTLVSSLKELVLGLSRATSGMLIGRVSNEDEASNEGWHLLKRATVANFLAIVLVSGFFVFLSEPLVSYIYGESYNPGPYLLSIMILAGAFQSIISNTSSGLMVLHRPWLLNILALITSILCVFGSMKGIHYGEVEGVAGGQLAALSFSAILYAFSISHARGKTR